MNTSDLAIATPGWIILSILVLVIGLYVFFYFITRPYEKQIDKKFPGLNKKINILLGLLLCLSLFIQTWKNILLGIEGGVGAGVLLLLITKYLITKHIVRTKNADLYVLKTIFIYIVIQIVVYLLGVLLGVLFF